MSGRYNAGYIDGQRDALAFLCGHVEDDDPFAALCMVTELTFALWMLGWNLAFAGGLKAAEVKGKATASRWNMRADDNWYRSIITGPQIPKAPAVRDYNDQWTPGKDGDIWSGWSGYGSRKK